MTSTISDALISGMETTGAGNTDRLMEIGRQLLIELGEDPDREGLADTPARWARWWREFMNHDDRNLETTFESVTTDQVVEVSGIRVWSLCEHHLLPFWCDVSIAYITRGRLVGLSKFARIAHAAAHRLQIQERLTSDIADAVEKLAQSPDVAVRSSGEHLCMSMRGVRTPATMSTSAFRGAFMNDPDVRARLSR